MTHRSLAFLIVLNVGLLAGLALMLARPQAAEAQFGAARTFTMISGAVTGRSNQAAVYVIDLNSSRVAPMFYNANRKRFEYFAGRQISEDMRRLTR